jgi:VIT1/CCC1 family predicted Fe2+/Mn2+ transporter
MYNRRYKNWNNFALGILVMIVPLLALPERLATMLLVVFGFFIALFSLAQVGSPSHDQTPPAL